MNKVSIIVPIYKVEKYLDKSVESLINQTYKNLEIILVDDGSPDNCPKICDEWSKKDKRIKVIHKENGGVSSARNIGLKNASGEYIMFCDSDDFMEKSSVENMVKAIKDADWAICGYNKIFDKKVQKIQFNNSDDCTECKISKIIHTWDFGLLWNKIYKKKLIDFEFNESFKVREDLLFNTMYLSKVKKINFVNEYLYNYIVRSGSLTHNIINVPIDQLLIVHNKMLEVIKNNEWNALLPHQNMAFISSLINLFKKYKVTKCTQEDRKKLLNYLSDERVVNALKNIKAISIKEKIFCYLIRRKKIKSIVTLLKIL